jgi:thioredoxin 2
MTEPLHAVCPLLRGQLNSRDRPPPEAKCGVCKWRLFAGEPIVLTSKTFDTHVERNDMPVIVDFWAP